jgi:3-phosphoshikimate 1-carboxyvinyltransferase
MTTHLDKSLFAADVPIFNGAGLRVKTLEMKNQVSVTIPGSKSFSNRALVCAGMCSTPVTLSGLLFADDTYWALLCLERLGFEIAIDSANSKVTVNPPQKPDELLSNLKILATDSQINPLFFGLAGTLARFFPAVILNLGKTFSISNLSLKEFKFLLSGEPKLCGRPLSSLIVALESLGALASSEALPLSLSPSDLQGRTEVDGSVSGQFLSGLLLAAAGSKTKINIQRVNNLVQPDYVRMTIDCLRVFGSHVNHDEELRHFEIETRNALRPPNDSYVVEADASTSCYFISMAVLLGIELCVLNIGSSTLQPDLKFVDFLTMLGAVIEVQEHSVKVIASKDRRRGIAEASAGFMPILFEGGMEVDFSKNSDQALTAGVVSLFCRNPIRVFGASHIRHHESDRIASLVANLAQLGVTFREFEDGFTSPGGEHKKFNGHWPTHGDHRFAMTGFLLALFNPDLQILNPSCVAKTAPGFFRQMEKFGVAFS